MRIEASQKAFISYHIKLDFLNHSNLKTDIQNRISNESEVNFQTALSEIQGDNKETKGTSFSELTLLAIAYFYERIFPEDVQIRDAAYTINSVKGFFDACNKTPYTSIYEVDTTCYELKDTALFKACFLIIQSAWFFNSEYFGRHQYLEYSSHYIKTGEQLPVEKYQYDKGDLSRKYSRIDEKRNTKHHPKGEPAFKFVDQWYYYILYLICNELDVPLTHFKTSTTNFREYNPLTKCPRILRAETPFKVIECDIKSAFPSFLDLQTGSRIKKDVYSNLMKRKKITRSQAKVEFNSYLNSGKYKSKEEIKHFLIECGYTALQAETITFYTNGKEKFITHMSDLEQGAVEDFKSDNDLHTSTRLHDSVLFIDKGVKHFDLMAENEIIEFGCTTLKNPVYTNSYAYSNKSLRYGYISSVPPATSEDYKNLERKIILTNPDVKGEANGFKFYTEKYEYIGASFNLNEKYSFEDFIYNCREMISTLNYLNDKAISKTHLYLFLDHIRKHSNIIFNVRYLFRDLAKHLNRIDDVMIQKRDFELTKNLTFRKKIDFLNALNKARGIVNRDNHLKTIKAQFEASIYSGKFEWIPFNIPKKRKNTALIHVITNNINRLRTWKKKMFKAQSQSCHPLYSSINIEGGTIKFEPHKFANNTRIAQRKIQRYEKQLIQYLELQASRNKALQYVHIISDLMGITPETNINRNETAISEEKKAIAESVEIKDFKSLCKEPNTAKVKAITPDINHFDTSMEHSAFNIGIEDARARGETFFQEYLKFNNLNHKQKEVVSVRVKKKLITLPKLDFDRWV